MGKKLVIGANGFIGSAIVRNLLSDGHEVRALVHDVERVGNLTGLDVDVVSGDILDEAAMVAAMTGTDTVFNTAAHFSHYNPVPQRAYEVNVTGTRTVLRAAEEAGVDKLVHTSTNNAVGAYGATAVTEEAEFNYWQSGDHYSQSKYFGEVEVLKAAMRGFPAVIVNPTYVIGTHDARPTSSGQLLIDQAMGRGLITMRGHLNIIDVEDVARAQITAATRGRIGERYLLGHTNISIPDFQALIADIAGVARPKFVAPYRLALGIAHAAEAVSRFTHKPPFQAVAAIKVGRMGESYDSSKAIAELDLPQTPLEDSIKSALDWFGANGYLTR
jgi:dihydroflavonol-4-reductase